MSKLWRTLKFDLRELVRQHPARVFWPNLLLPIALVALNIVAFKFGLPSWLYLTLSITILTSWLVVATVTTDAFYDVPWWVVFILFVTVFYYAFALWNLLQVVRGRRTIEFPTDT